MDHWLRVISASHLSHEFVSSGSLSVKVISGSTQHVTKPVGRSDNPKWDEVFKIPIAKKDAELRIQLCQKSTKSLITHVRGDISVKWEHLEKSQAEYPNGFQLRLMSKSRGGEARPVCWLLFAIVNLQRQQSSPVDPLPILEHTGNALNHARYASHALDTTRPPLSGSRVSDNAKEGFEAVIENLNDLIDLVDEATKIHPIIRLTWLAMTSVVKAIHGQYERDDKIIDLVETMDNAYGFIAVLKESPDLFPRLEAIVEATLKETLECAMFMQEYCSVGFMSRLIRQSFDTPMRRRIDDFKASFEKLGASRQEGEVIQTVLTTTSILNVVTSLHRDRILQQLQPMTMDAVERSSCLPKTRIRYLRDISAWVLDASRKDKNILWLYGLPGSGKSAIANSIAQSFRGHSRLGAFLFFNDREHLSTPAALIRTLAAQLALFDERINAAVSKALQMNPDVTKSSLAAQFTQLLVGPLNSDSVAPVSGRGAVVVVIDALESCGNPASREELLSVLVNQCGQLPKWLRVVIISRKEQDIEDALGLLPNVCRMELDITCDSNAADIEIYLRYTMGKIATSPKNRDLDLKQWPSNGDIQALSRRSAGLIIWASRASSFVDSHNPRAQLETLLASDSDCTLLDGFFADTLRSIGSWDDPDFTTSFQTVMGAMIVAEEPMTHKMIDGLFNLHEHSPSLHTIKMLGCFLTRTPADLVQPLHPTLIQYLADPRRCQGEKWFVDASQHRHVLASRCLRLVVFHLTDNYSGSPRPDRSALEHLINHTPPSVRHAFRYWTVYISSIVDKIEELPSDIRLIFIPDNFLNWCRVIEAHWTSEAVVDLASRLLKWAKMNSPRLVIHGLDSQSLDRIRGVLSQHFQIEVSEDTSPPVMVAGNGRVPIPRSLRPRVSNTHPTPAPSLPPRPRLSDTADTHASAMPVAQRQMSFPEPALPIRPNVSGPPVTGAHRYHALDQDDVRSTTLPNPRRRPTNITPGFISEATPFFHPSNDVHYPSGLVSAPFHEEPEHMVSPYEQSQTNPIPTPPYTPGNASNRRYPTHNAVPKAPGLHRAPYASATLPSPPSSSASSNVSSFFPAPENPNGPQVWLRMPDKRPTGGNNGNRTNG